MNTWWKDLRSILILAAVIITVLFTVFLINQFMLLYQFLSLIHPIFAAIVMLALLGGIIYLGFKIGRKLFNKPAVIELAEGADDETYQEYLNQLVEQLKKNPHLSDIDFMTDETTQEEKIQQSFTHLHESSLPLIKENANAIFLSTAISQNGALDSYVVLITLIRMVWQLAEIYGTRPSLVSLLKLYSQVGSIVLMARTLEDTDLIETQMEPLITSIIGESIASAIPGMVPIANLVVSSLMEGSVNAFLTLRVGLITQDYLSSQQALDKRTLRRSTSVQSISYLGQIIRSNGKVVVKTIGNAAKNASVGTAKRWFGFDGKAK